MALETGSYVGDLVASNPTGGSDFVSAGDDHIRLIKSVLQNTFPNATRGYYFEEVSTKTANYTTSVTDQNKLIKMDASTGIRTVSLLSAATAGQGFIIRVEKVDNTNNDVIIDAAGAQTIGGSLTWTLDEQYDTVSLMSDGNNWTVLGSNISRETLNPTTVNATTLNATTGNITNIVASDVDADTGTIDSFQATTINATSATFTGTVTANDISIGALNSTPVGNVTPSSGAFSTLSASSAASFSSTVSVGNTLSVTNGISAGSLSVTGSLSAGGTISGSFSGTLSGNASGSTASYSTGSFTSVSTGTMTASGAVSGAGGTFSGDVSVSGFLNCDSEIRFYDGVTEMGKIDKNDTSYSLIMHADPSGVQGADAFAALNVGGNRYIECQNDKIKLANFTINNAHTSSSAEQSFWVHRDNSNITVDAAGAELVMRINRCGASDGEILQFRRNGTNVGSIDVAASATSYNTSSDRRLKQNIKMLPGALDILAQLKPREFEFRRKPGERMVGFIAQELLPVFPQAVSVPTQDVIDGEKQYMGVDLSKLVPVLTSALQEAVKKIEKLEKRLEKLEK